MEMQEHFAKTYSFKDKGKRRNVQSLLRATLWGVHNLWSGVWTPGRWNGCKQGPRRVKGSRGSPGRTGSSEALAFMDNCKHPHTGSKADEDDVKGYGTRRGKKPWDETDSD